MLLEFVLCRYDFPMLVIEFVLVNFQCFFIIVIRNLILPFLFCKVSKRNKYISKNIMIFFEKLFIYF